jgi:integrase
MRKLFREYTKYMQIDVQNPFEKLSYADPKRHRKIVPPFETAYIRDTFLKGEALRGLNRGARLIFLAMVETGCRPSELCNIRPENIHLDAAVPYLSVTFVDDRRLKTENSVRKVPLVGVSLEAMKRAKNGFPRYLDKEGNFSNAAMKFLRENELLPTVNHRVYSIRHSYEKRMLEGGMDDEFRRRTLGHDTNRPEYGDGGALTWRAEQMERIALTFDKAIFD